MYARRTSVRYRRRSVGPWDSVPKNRLNDNKGCDDGAQPVPRRRAEGSPGKVQQRTANGSRTRIIANGCTRLREPADNLVRVALPNDRSSRKRPRK